MKLKKGIIVSLQGYHSRTIDELARDAISGMAVGLKIDKPLKIAESERVPLIGCHKINVNSPEKEAYLTPNIEQVKNVAAWSDYVSIDYRAINKNLPEISEYCRANKIKVIADIGTHADYDNIIANGYHFEMIATTFCIFTPQYRFTPNIDLACDIMSDGVSVLAEGNFTARYQVREAMNRGIDRICIGGAISNVYKLTRKFTTVKKDKK